MPADPVTVMRVDQLEARVDKHDTALSALPEIEANLKNLSRDVEKLSESAARMTVALYSLAGGVIIAAIVFALTVASSRGG